MSKITDAEANATSLDGLVNDNGLITTLRNGPKPSWQYIVDQVYAQLGYAVAGSFVDGFTYTGIRQVGADASGNTWIYTGGEQNLPHVVPAGTVPSAPDYFQVSVNSADNVVLDNGENLQQAIDRLNLEIDDVESKLNIVNGYEDIQSVSNSGEDAALIISGEGVSRSGIIKHEPNHGLTSNSKNIEVINQDLYWQMMENNENSSRYRSKESVPLTVTSLNGILSEFMASVNRRRPRVSPIINEKAQRIMGTDYCDFVTPESKGAASDGVVFGSYPSVTGEVLAPLFMFSAPIDNATGSVSLSITIDPIDGSSLDDVSVQWGQWKTYEDGLSQIGSGRFNITRSGNTWSVTPTLNGAASIGDLFGLHVSCAAGAGDYEVTAITLTDSAGKEYKLTRRIKQNLAINLVAVESKSSVLVQEFGDIEVRNHGLKSGFIPSKFFAAPSADDTSGAKGTFIGGTEVYGHTYDTPLPPSQCFFKSETYFINGYTPPATILAAGTYTNYYSVGHIRPFNTGIFTRPSEWFIGCPNGLAILSSGASSNDGLILGAAQGADFTKMYLMNIHCDETITRPYVVARIDVDALNISTAYSEVEGIDIDFSDVTIERGEFYGAENDGVNSQANGHTILIDTICRNNLDDGFSPHNDCTYEVYGGEYKENGKGNIIPAFGAKGFVVDTLSSGSTGLSPRAATDAGIANGGFVCISDDGDRATTMFMTECSSENDTNGFVSAGKNCVIYTYGCSSLTPTDNELVANYWNSATSNSSGESGLIITNSEDVSSYSIIDDDSLVTNYIDGSFRWS